jgi:hypothetical protein
MLTPCELADFRTLLVDEGNVGVAGELAEAVAGMESAEIQRDRAVVGGTARIEPVGSDRRPQRGRIDRRDGGTRKRAVAVKRDRAGGEQAVRMICCLDPGRVGIALEISGFAAGSLRKASCRLWSPPSGSKTWIARTRCGAAPLTPPVAPYAARSPAV